MTDLIAFLIILALFIIAFAASRLMIGMEYGFDSAYQSIFDEWLLIFGEYKEEDYNAVMSYDTDWFGKKMTTLPFCARWRRARPIKAMVSR